MYLSTAHPLLLSGQGFPSRRVHKAGLAGTFQGTAGTGTPLSSGSFLPPSLPNVLQVSPPRALPLSHTQKCQQANWSAVSPIPQMKHTQAFPCDHHKRCCVCAPRSQQLSTLPTTPFTSSIQDGGSDSAYPRGLLANLPSARGHEARALLHPCHLPSCSVSWELRSQKLGVLFQFRHFFLHICI